MQNKICLITGATSGIGLVTAHELARQGAHVVLVGRNLAKISAVVAKIESETGNRNVRSLLADLSSQHQVHVLARQFMDQYPCLDVLLNNAGGIHLKREQTVDGLEMTFAVNHLSYFLLTNLLLDRLKASPNARIVNVSSEAHRKASIDFGDIMGDRGYGGWRQYCRSKLMNLMFTYELSRQLAGTHVTANALHPGWVFTGFGGNNGWKGWIWRLVSRCFAISAEEGARTVISAASSPEIAGLSGRYFVRQEAVSSSTDSYDETSAKRLWKLSMELSNQVVPR